MKKFKKVIEILKQMSVIRKSRYGQRLAAYLSINLVYIFM